MTRSVEQIFDEVRTVPDWFERPITSVHDRNGYGDTPLHIVANWGDCKAIKTLIEIGADINAKGEAGLTPLHCAVEQERPEAIVLLLPWVPKSSPTRMAIRPCSWLSYWGTTS